MRSNPSHIRSLVGSSVLGAIAALALAILALVGPNASADPTTTEPPTTTTPTTAPTTTTKPPTPTTKPTPTTAKPKTTTTTAKPKTTTTTSGSSSSTATTVAPTSTSSAPAVLVPPPSGTIAPKSSGDGGGFSAETKLRLVVGGLVAVGLGVSLLTVLYWRRTRPPAINTALGALGGLDVSAAVVPPDAGGTPVPPVTAATPAVDTQAAPEMWLAPGPGAAPTVAAAGLATGAAGTGVRILGPVAAGAARAETTTETTTEGADPDQAGESEGSASPTSSPSPLPQRPTAAAVASAGAAATIEPEPLAIVTLEDLQKHAEEPPSDPAAPAPDPADDDYGDVHG